MNHLFSLTGAFLEGPQTLLWINLKGFVAWYFWEQKEEHFCLAISQKSHRKEDVLYLETTEVTKIGMTESRGPYYYRLEQS